MHKALIFGLKSLRKLSIRILPMNYKSFPNFVQDSEVVSTMIYDELTNSHPCMIARFGSTELSVLVNYLGVREQPKNVLKYLYGKGLPWWWEENLINQLQNWSGFFPAQVNQVEKFCELMIDDMKNVDILGSWLFEEKYFENRLTAQKVQLKYLDPFWSKLPWTRALEGKKVLVVHPFQSTIESQYKKRELIFSNNLLPEFDLKTIKAIQSIAMENTQFQNWFEALDYMKAEIDKVDFDICIIGAGAYGFPLAAHVKRQGKKAVHLGGSTQLLFGIKGKRWDDSNLYNEHWTRPSMFETPAQSSSVENGCYW